MAGIFSGLASLDRNARRYLATYALSMGGYLGVITVLLNLYLVRLGFGNRFVGTINGLSLAIAAITSTPAGEIGRRIGPRAAILTGLVMGTAGVALIPAAGWLPGPLLPLGIVSGSLLLFFGGPLYAANWSPYLMEIVSEGDRVRLFSLRSAPLAPAPLPAGPDPLTGAHGRRIPRHARHRTHSRAGARAGGREAARPRTSPRAHPAVAAAGLLRQGGVWVARSFYNVYLDRELDTPTALIGAVAAFAQLGAIPAPLLMPPLVRRWGKAAAVTVATLRIAGGLVVLAAVRHWLGVAAGFALLMASFMVATAAVELFQQELVAPEWRSVIAGICLTGNMAGSAVMVLSSGFLVERVGFGGIYSIGAAGACASAALFAAVFVRRRRPAAAA